ncbi:DNA cytosine methyltransferase [Sphingobium yanoikuyae]|uniref:DNA cytosine methyltransferase n=1 Tax=Sphingobium yanoikuyae TaxID=13690 RepID=UPI0026F03CC5|nr:DNA cytosine methyltransferase [Sphingobium yanoikuyae]
MATAYYNEIDPFAAAWLRELIARDVIAPGIVDERSIEDVCPDELAGFTQCHFFAGIGVHSHALRRAGWADDRPIWTGSCPCQPFSAAGQGKGFADERHLWPAFYHLIEQCEPAVVAGEQVSGGGVGVWFDLVQADMEAMGYAFGLVPLPAAGFGGAHIRDRAFWVADATGSGQPWASRSGGAQEQRVAELRRAGGMADTGRRLLQYQQQLGGDGSAPRQTEGEAWKLERGRAGDRNSGAHGGLGHNWRADAPMLGREPSDWLFCRDGKWRPVGPGTFPLAHEAPARVGRLRGYGNAIDAETLTQFYAALIGHLDGYPIGAAA